jgi:transcriptional regulator with XRE-family HTH domain
MPPPEEFVRELNQLGLSLPDAAEALCVDLRSLRRYMDGSRRVSPAMAKLLRALIALGRTEV